MIQVASSQAAASGAPVLDPESLRMLEARIEREIKRLVRTAQQIGSLEFQRGGDEADLTASRLGHAADVAVLSRCVDGLAEWTEALDRIRTRPESFGRCVTCCRPIEMARLEILPTARTCVSC